MKNLKQKSWGIQYFFYQKKKKKKERKLYDEIFLKGILPSDAQVVRSYICTYVVYKVRILGLLNQSLLSILRVSHIDIFETSIKEIFKSQQHAGN